MGLQWNLHSSHETTFDYSTCANGTSNIYFHRARMGHSINSAPLGRPRDLHGASVELPWDSSILMGLQWDFHGTSMGLPSDLMLFPWDSHFP